MKNLSKTDKQILQLLGIWIVIMVFFAISSSHRKTKKKEFVKIHPSVCEYYIDFEAHCPYDLEKEYLVELEFIDYKNRDAVVVADTINDAHKTFLKEKLIYLSKNHQ